MHIETILEQGRGPLNEDTLIAQNNIYGVFDGATSLDEKKTGPEDHRRPFSCPNRVQVFSKNHFPLKRLGCEANDAIRSKLNALQVDLEKGMRSFLAVPRWLYCLHR